MKVIPETRRAQQILYLRFHLKRSMVWENIDKTEMDIFKFSGKCKFY